MLQTTGSEQHLSATLVALSDPTRRAIVRRLARGEARVTEVAEPFDMSLNAVSKHIRVLERARLVVRRRAGREHFLSLDVAPLDGASSWIESTRAFWSARLDALAEFLESEQARAEPPKGTKQR